MADKFKSMVSLRTPVGKGNGLPMKGQAKPIFGPTPKNVIPLTKKK